MLQTAKARLACVLAISGLVAGCGSGSGAPTGSRAGTAGGSPAAAQPGGALSADAHSAATGDIPDNQVFLVFTNRGARYSIKYPEGWTQSGTTDDVTFRDKNNVVRLVAAAGPAPTPARVVAQLRSLARSAPTLRFRSPSVVRVGATSAVKITYETKGAPDPVTGKRVTLVVDRYEVARGGRVVTVELGTPTGVDNVDAYRMMIQSFRWL